jgi:hypothetical protein
MSLDPLTNPPDYAAMRATIRELNESFDELVCGAADCPGRLRSRAGVLVCERCDSRR